MSTNAGRKWFIRNLKGLTYGPYEEDRLLELIRMSIFTGDESVSEFPGGEWKLLSKIPLFYDLILEGLSREAPHLDEATIRKELSQTTVMISNTAMGASGPPAGGQTQTRQLTEEEQQAAKAQSEAEHQRRLKKKRSAQEEAVKEWPSADRKIPPPNDSGIEILKPANIPIDSTAMTKHSEAVVDLVDEREVRKQQRKQNLKPVVFLAVALVVSYFILNMRDGKESPATNVEKLHLLGPAEAPGKVKSRGGSSQNQESFELLHSRHGKGLWPSSVRTG